MRSRTCAYGCLEEDDDLVWEKAGDDPNNDNWNDCGTDGLCDGDVGYQDPDGDGTEGNKKWDEGEKRDGNNEYDYGEKFEDLGNGHWDDGESFTDKKNNKYDLGEEFFDKPDGKWNEGEEYLDLISDGIYTSITSEYFYGQNACWNDSDSDGQWDNDEPYIDLNGNSQWDDCYELNQDGQCLEEPFSDLNFDQIWTPAEEILAPGSSSCLQIDPNYSHGKNENCDNQCLKLISHVK